MKDNKIWRVENLESVHDDCEIEDSEINESKTEKNDNDEDNESP